MKIIKQAHLIDVLTARGKEEITFSRAAEILNEIAREAVNAKLQEAADKICEVEKQYDAAYEFDRASGAGKCCQIVLNLQIKEQ